MKKKIILSFATLVLFTTAVSPIYASKDISPLPSWFTKAIKPIQNSINSLFQKTGNNETRIVELERKTSNLSSADFALPNQWDVSFYEDRRIVMSTRSDSIISLPDLSINYHCSWNKTIIDLTATARAIAHINTGDIYGVGTCKEITFKPNDIPASGTTFEVDIYIFWQGTEKHAKQTVNIPERPFRSLLTINNGGSLLINQNSNGSIASSSGTIGIGTTSATERLIIDCGIYNCSDLLKLNN